MLFCLPDIGRGQGEKQRGKEMDAIKVQTKEPIEQFRLCATGEKATSVFLCFYLRIDKRGTRVGPILAP